MRGREIEQHHRAAADPVAGVVQRGEDGEVHRARPLAVPDRDLAFPSVAGERDASRGADPSPGAVAERLGEVPVEGDAHDRPAEGPHRGRVLVANPAVRIEFHDGGTGGVEEGVELGMAIMGPGRVPESLFHAPGHEEHEGEERKEEQGIATEGVRVAEHHEEHGCRGGEPARVRRQPEEGGREGEDEPESRPDLGMVDSGLAARPRRGEPAGDDGGEEQDQSRSDLQEPVRVAVVRQASVPVGEEGDGDRQAGQEAEREAGHLMGEIDLEHRGADRSIEDRPRPGERQQDDGKREDDHPDRVAETGLPRGESPAAIGHDGMEAEKSGGGRRAEADARDREGGR